MDQRVVQKGDLVRLKGEESNFLYLVACVLEDDIDGHLIKMYDESGKMVPVEDGMFYRSAAIEIVASR